MQRVVITAQAVDNGLFWGRLVFIDIIGFPILWDGLALGRRTRNKFRKLLSSGFGAEIEIGTLSRQMVYSSR